MVKIPLIIPVMIPHFSGIVIEFFRILFTLAMYHIYKTSRFLCDFML